MVDNIVSLHDRQKEEAASSQEHDQFIRSELLELLAVLQDQVREGQVTGLLMVSFDVAGRGSVPLALLPAVGTTYEILGAVEALKHEVVDLVSGEFCD